MKGESEIKGDGRDGATAIVKIYAPHFFRVELFDVSLGEEGASDTRYRVQQHIPRTAPV